MPLILAALFYALVLLLSVAGGGLGGVVAAEQQGLAGWLLVASEKMGDPRFDKTLVYLVEHNSEGAMGLVVNVPMGEVPFTDLFERLGIDAEDAAGGVAGGIEVYYGGPVDPGRGFLLHSSDVLLDDSIRIDERMAMTSRPEILTAIARGEGPTQALFTLGYAGWAPGQLESELARDVWFVIPADASLVFATDPAASWRRAAQQRSLDL